MKVLIDVGIGYPVSVFAIQSVGNSGRHVFVMLTSGESKETNLTAEQIDKRMSESLEILLHLPKSRQAKQRS